MMTIVATVSHVCTMVFLLNSMFGPKLSVEAQNTFRVASCIWISVTIWGLARNAYYNKAKLQCQEAESLSKQTQGIEIQVDDECIRTFENKNKFSHKSTTCNLVYENLDSNGCRSSKLVCFTGNRFCNCSCSCHEKRLNTPESDVDISKTGDCCKILHECSRDSFNCNCICHHAIACKCQSGLEYISSDLNVKEPAGSCDFHHCCGSGTDCCRGQYCSKHKIADLSGQPKEFQYLQEESSYDNQSHGELLEESSRDQPYHHHECYCYKCLGVEDSVSSNDSSESHRAANDHRLNCTCYYCLDVSAYLSGFSLGYSDGVETHYDSDQLLSSPTREELGSDHADISLSSSASPSFCSVPEFDLNYYLDGSLDSQSEWPETPSSFGSFDGNIYPNTGLDFEHPHFLSSPSFLGSLDLKCEDNVPTLSPELYSRFYSSLKDELVNLDSSLSPS